MRRDYLLYVNDIISSIEKIREYVADMTYEEFERDNKTQDAIIRNLEVIGEAVKGIPDEIRLSMTEIDWRKIIGLRNLLIHEYFGISLPIVWDVICNKLDELYDECLKINKRS